MLSNNPSHIKYYHPHLISNCSGAISIESITNCLVYIPPKSSEEYVQKYLAIDFITSLNNSFNNLVLLGDFNFSDINWESLNASSPLSNKFCDVNFDLFN